MSVRLRIAAARLRRQRNEWSNHNHEQQSNRDRLNNRVPRNSLGPELSNRNVAPETRSELNVRLVLQEPNDRCDQCNSSRKVNESQRRRDHSHSSVAW
jgi:hypothetical protein